VARRVIFSDEARADIRAIDRETVLGLLTALTRFLKTDVGDIKQLHGLNPPQYRLRVGDWRIIFRKCGADSVDVVRSVTAARLTADDGKPKYASSTVAWLAFRNWRRTAINFASER